MQVQRKFIFLILSLSVIEALFIDRAIGVRWHHIQIACRVRCILDFDLSLVDDTHILITVVVVIPTIKHCIALAFFFIVEAQSDNFVSSLKLYALHWQVVHLLSKLCRVSIRAVVYWNLVAWRDNS